MLSLLRQIGCASTALGGFVPYPSRPGLAVLRRVVKLNPPPPPQPSFLESVVYERLLENIQLMAEPVIRSTRQPRTQTPKQTFDAATALFSAVALDAAPFISACCLDCPTHIGGQMQAGMRPLEASAIGTAAIQPAAFNAPHRTAVCMSEAHQRMDPCASSLVV